MGDNGSFRSSFMGFNRDDVVSYVSGVIEESAANAAKVVELQKKLSEIEKDYNELSDRYFRLKNEYEESVKKEGLCDKCTECDLNKQNEAKLGAAMLEAKRFSDLIVKEANDRAKEVYTNAFENVSESKQTASAVLEQVKNVSEEAERAFSLLQGNLNSLISNMELFSVSIDNKTEKFDYRSEFSDSIVENKQRTVEDNG